MLDQTVEGEILKRFDRTFLNLDARNFLSQVPTTENVCGEVFDLLRDRIEGGTPQLSD